MKTFLTILITALLAVGATWFALREQPQESLTTDRKPLYYQSAMHPWIKSDKPGRCTICGMELTPVYPGEKGFDATGGGSTIALTDSQIQVLNVRTETAKIQPLARTLQVSGVIDDDSTRHRVLSAYTDGRIDKLHVNYMGAEVEAGQPLAEFYSPALLQAEREYRQLSGELRKNTGLRLRQMGLTPEQLEAIPNKSIDSLTSQILSPVSGTVVEQNVYEGQYVATGEKLFEIADFSTMWFMFDAYEQDMPWIQTGQTVTVSSPALPGKSFEGKITFIDPNFEEATRSTKVRVELPNPKIDGHRALLHRLYAEGLVKIDTPAVLTIPRSALIQTGPEAVVYVDLEGGAYAHTPVKTGRHGDTDVEILSGLKAGDKVVTHGNLQIDGQAEMKRAFMPPATTTASTPADLTEEQIRITADFLRLADTMSSALAADNLTAFNKAAEPAMTTTEAFIQAIADLPVSKENLQTLEKSRHFHGYQDLQSARVAFNPFSMAAA